jgi:hypothetical protein
MARLRPDPRRCAPPLLAAALAALYLVWQPPSLDLAAADYRAWLFGHGGFAVWDLRWYAGHHLPGYSVLFPPLGWWVGTRLTGALATVAAAVLFERLARDRYGARAWLGALWFGAGAASPLFSGRLTFALGIVPALGALLALERGLRARPDGRRRALLALAVGLAALTPLASPVAALFLALAGAAVALAAHQAPDHARRRSHAGTPVGGRLPGLALAAAALVPIAAFALAFPEGGTEPFHFGSLWPLLAFAAIGLALLPREERTLRAGIVLYVLAGVAVLGVHTPVGSNVMRLGALCAGPVAALTLQPGRRLVLLLVAPLLLWWQWSAAISDVRTASNDPSVGAAYYAPLLRELRAARTAGSGQPGRVEIPFTRLHWEARHVAPAFPLARGWERQLDVKTNALFYDGTLTAARYRAWLERMAVRWVAVPDVRLDYSARTEARLIARGLPYLRELWRDRHWRLYAVRDPAPLVQHPGRALALGGDTLTLVTPRRASLLVRVRWTPYWDVAAGDACVAPAGDWTRVGVRQPGLVRLVIRFSLDRIGARSARCGKR